MSSAADEVHGKFILLLCCRLIAFNVKHKLSKNHCSFDIIITSQSEVNRTVTKQLKWDITKSNEYKIQRTCFVLSLVPRTRFDAMRACLTRLQRATCTHIASLVSSRRK